MSMHARRTARTVCVCPVAGRLLYVPAGLAETVRSHVQLSGRLRASLEEISRINLELLSRRELD